MLMIDFDSPSDPNKSRWGSSTPLDLEYMPSPGDSGGGLFIDVAGQTRVAGITSFGYPSSNSLYGDAAGYMRVSQFNAWIDDQISIAWSNPSDGAFGTGTNWTGASPAGANDIAAFNVAGTYTVTFAADAANERMLVRGGHVTLDLGGHTYGLTSPSVEGSVIVGRYLGNDASLTISNGTLVSPDGVIAESPGSIGQVTVAAGGAWNSGGSVYVGGNGIAAGGTGTLQSDKGGALSVTGSLKAWAGGTVILDGGILTAGNVDLTGGRLYSPAGASLASPLSSTGGTVQVDGGILSLTGPLSVAAGSSLAKSGAGALLIGGAQSHGANSMLNILAGSVNMSTDAGAGGANLAIVLADNALASAVFSSTQHLRVLSIGSTDVATLSGPSGRIIRTSGLTIGGGLTPTGKLDLAGNDLIVDYGQQEASPLGTIRAQLAAGYGTNHDWSGTAGITTSLGSAANFALGLAEASDLFTSFPATFSDEPNIDSTAVLVKYTYYGDANLSGGTDFADLSVVVTHYNQSGSWATGDFNYDGQINFADLGLLLANYNSSGLGILDDQALTLLVANGFSVDPSIVPEPATAGLLMLCAAGFAMRRRRITSR